MDRSAPLAALAAVALLVGLFPATASAARFTCAGEPATIVGTPGDDTLRGTPGRDVVAARAGDDIIDGRGGDDLLCGGTGADVLRGGPGDDVLRGGPLDYAAEPDLVVYDTAGRGVHVDLTRGTATGQGQDRVLGRHVGVYGSEHDDVILGADGRNNVLAGLGGNDRLVGGDDADRIFGDNPRPTRVAGRDRLLGGGGSDYLNGGAGNDVARGGAGDDYLLEWEEMPSGADRLFGGPGPDYLGDALEPGTVQTFTGGAGEDALVLSTYFRSATGRRFPSGRILLDRSFTTYGARPATGTASSFETLVAPVGGWRIVGTGADERLWAPRGVVDPRERGITVLGRGGDDNIIGTDYDDVLDGGAGFDQVCRRGGRDTVTNAEARRRWPIYLCDPR